MPRELAPPADGAIRLTHSPEPDDSAHDPSSSALYMNMGRRSSNPSSNGSSSSSGNLTIDNDQEGGSSGADGEDEHEYEHDMDPPAYEYAIYGGADQELNDRELQLSNAFRRGDDLHPIVQALSISDLDACVALEHATFPENERASREKLEYRLTACPSLSLGIFSSTHQKAAPESEPAWAAGRAPDSSKPNHKYLLIGHVLGTMTSADRVTEGSMAFPSSFKPASATPDLLPTTATDPIPDPASTSSSYSSPPPVPAKEPPPPPPKSTSTGLPTANQPSSAPGHHPHGRTIAIHSVAVLPQFQKAGLGKTVLRSYLQRMESAGIADQAVLLAHQNMVPFYVEQFGFEDRGESEIAFAGGGWRDMVYTFNDLAHWG